MKNLNVLMKNDNGLLATDGKLFYVKKFKCDQPWRLFTTQKIAMTYLNDQPVPSMIRW